jgi:hypothetical protein
MRSRVAIARGRDGDRYVQIKTISHRIDIGARLEHGRACPGGRRGRRRRGRRSSRGRRGCKQRGRVERHFERDGQSGKFEHDGQQHQYGVREHEFQLRKQ